MANYIYGFSDNITDTAQFGQALNQATSLIHPRDGLFISDESLLWHRNLSFLDDIKLMSLMTQHASTHEEKAIIWRTYIYIWCLEQALRLDGDLIECGCYRGTTVRIACDYVDFARYTDKRFKLYDLFDPAEYGLMGSKPDLGPGLYEQVVARFADLPNVQVTKGRVPDSLIDTAPERIAFLHLDMNDAGAELGALQQLYERIVPGGWILLDDYGWLRFRQQKAVEDQFFEAHGVRALELPTGQAIVIKP